MLICNVLVMLLQCSVMFDIFMLKTLLWRGLMKINELYPDVIAEDLCYEYKAVLNPDSPSNGQKLL